MWPVPTDPVQCIGQVESAWKDLYWILPPSVTGILQNCMLCHFYKLEGSVLSLESPAGRDIGVASPNQSCTVHWQNGVCIERPAQETLQYMTRTEPHSPLCAQVRPGRMLLSLESPAGRDIGVASPNRSCTVHWQSRVCIERPALDTTT